MVKRLEDINGDGKIPKSVKGGVIFKKSHCCGAPIKYTGGGVKIPYCSKCGKTYEEFRLR